MIDERDTVLSGQWNDESEELEPTRTVALIEASKMTTIMKSLEEALAI